MIIELHTACGAIQRKLVTDARPPRVYKIVCRYLDRAASFSDLPDKVDESFPIREFEYTGQMYGDVPIYTERR